MLSTTALFYQLLSVNIILFSKIFRVERKEEAAILVTIYLIAENNNNHNAKGYQQSVKPAEGTVNPIVIVENNLFFKKNSFVVLFSS